MMQDAARSLRKGERYLLVPPLAATFGEHSVAVCDISAQGARFRHATLIETGTKAALKLPLEGNRTVILEAIVVWTERDESGKFLSGVRTYGAPESVAALLAQLRSAQRSTRIEELRAADRFIVAPTLVAHFGGREVRVENLSAHGARIETTVELKGGTSSTVTFKADALAVDTRGEVRWSMLKAITGSATRTWRAGLFIAGRPELMRLAIGHLAQTGRAALDTRSLSLKLKILSARARHFAPSYKKMEESGIPAEHYLLIHGVREELRLNPEEAMHWYRRARLVINDPATRQLAPGIVDHPDALAVWEYLDRSLDPSVVAAALELPSPR